MKNNFLLFGKAIPKEEKPLQTSSPLTNNSFIQQIWLQYFNNYLYEHKVITEDEWRKFGA